MAWGGGEEVHTQISLDLARDTPTPELTDIVQYTYIVGDAAVQWDTPTPERTLHFNDPLYKRGTPQPMPSLGNALQWIWDCSEINGTTPSFANCLHTAVHCRYMDGDHNRYTNVLQLTTKPLPPMCCTLDW